MQGYSALQVLNFLAESVSQPGKPAHAYPHGQVLALYEARGNMLFIRLTADGTLNRPAALAGAVFTAQSVCPVVRRRVLPAWRNPRWSRRYPQRPVDRPCGRLW